MTFQRPWHKSYPSNIPNDPDFEQITIIGAMMVGGGRLPDGLIYKSPANLGVA